MMYQYITEKIDLMLSKFDSKDVKTLDEAVRRLDMACMSLIYTYHNTPFCLSRLAGKFVFDVADKPDYYNVANAQVESIPTYLYEVVPFRYKTKRTSRIYFRNIPDFGHSWQKCAKNIAYANIYLKDYKKQLQIELNKYAIPDICDLIIDYLGFDLINFVLLEIENRFYSLCADKTNMHIAICNNLDILLAFHIIHGLHKTYFNQLKKCSWIRAHSIEKTPGTF